MTDKNQSANRQPLKALFLGTLSGIVTETFCYPFEFTKNAVQLDPKFAGKGMRYTMSNIYSQYGWKGFFRGLDCQLTSGSLRVSARFGIYEFLRKYLFIEDTMSNQFFAGIVTGAIKSVIITCPFESLKIKLTNDILNNTGKYSNFVQCFRVVYREHGFLELYKGLTPTIIKISSNNGFRFLWYEQLMRYYKEHKTGDSIFKDSAASFMVGGTGGAISVMLNNPVDFVKTQMQSINNQKYKNSIDCAIQIYNNEGIKGFYRGCTPRMCRVFFEIAISFTLFDLLKKATY